MHMTGSKFLMEQLLEVPHSSPVWFNHSRAILYFRNQALIEFRTDASIGGRDGFSTGRVTMQIGQSDDAQASSSRPIPVHVPEQCRRQLEHSRTLGLDNYNQLQRNGHTVLWRLHRYL